MAGARKTVGVILDITRQKAAEKSREIVERQVRNQALHDTLTGLENRTLFHESVLQAISEAQQGGMSWPCSSWTWTGSRRSTTRSAM